MREFAIIFSSIVQIMFALTVLEIVAAFMDSLSKLQDNKMPHTFGMKSILKKVAPAPYQIARDYALYGSRIFKSNAPLFPTVMIIGAPRCGTSFLHHYLLEHPSILDTYKKEINFFNFNYHRGIKWYGWNLPINSPASTDKLCLDATPSYLLDELVAPRIKKDLPETKFIVQLRNPVDRAFSSHAKNTKLGFETCSFEDALKREDELIANRQKPYHPAFMYKQNGLYASYLKHWFNFFPRNRFYILKSENLFSAPEKQYQDVLQFMGLPSQKIQKFKKVNGATNSVMNSETKASLEEFYHKPNEELNKILNGFTW